LNRKVVYIARIAVSSKGMQQQQQQQQQQQEEVEKQQQQQLLLRHIIWPIRIHTYLTGAHIFSLLLWRP